MHLKMHSILSRLRSNLNPKAQSLETLTWSSRSYCTSTTKPGKSSLYSKISPLGNSKTIIPELDNWLQNGNKVSISELNRIIHDLRKRKRFSHALEISEWMDQKSLCPFSPTNHAVQLDLIGKVRGFLSAESHFNNLKDQDKTAKTYGALLNCYARQVQTDKCMSHWQKMKEIGFASSPLTYNSIMCLYSRLGQYEKIPDLLKEMKKNNVPPDNFSYRICINSYGAKSDLEGVESLLKEMESEKHIDMDWNTYAVAANFYIRGGLIDKAVDALKKSEERLGKKDGLGYGHLITLYASLGMKDNILRLWDLEKSTCKKQINRDYLNMLESLVRLGTFEEAEKLLKEWESSGNQFDFRVPNVVLVGYLEKGLPEKAETLLKDLKEKGKVPTANNWAMVASGYLDKGEMEKAIECIKTAISQGMQPNSKMRARILSSIGEKGSIEDVESFVSLLKTVIPMNREMYHALLKAYIRGGKQVDGLLESMKADQIDENAETKKIICVKQRSIEP
ncbi:Pentatricopeptide repeat [Dillenia turbinata]|uniref:Pentatricopeptide repeat n=1 Tax=Dillenia turbinata TaxID=194707 RepID=A0AAN8UL69_9MAGN